MRKPKRRVNLPDKALTEYSTEERRAWIINYIQDYGFWNFNYTEMSRRFNCDRHLIKTDVDLIKEHVDIIDADETKFECGRILRLITRKGLLVMNNPRVGEETKIRWANTLLSTVRAHMDFLEDNNLLNTTRKRDTGDLSFRDFLLAYEIAEGSKQLPSSDPEDDDEEDEEELE